MSKPVNTIPAEKLELYNQLIAALPEIERKGKTVPYTSVNGHMFSFLDKDGIMGLRLSKEDRENFVQEYNTPPMVQYGSVMKEYVKIPDELLSNTQKLSDYLKISYEYVKSLKPKPTKKNK